MQTTAGRRTFHADHPGRSIRRSVGRSFPMEKAALLLAIAMLGIGSAGASQAAAALPSQAQVTEVAYKAVDVFPIRFGGLLRLIGGSVMLVPATLFSTLSLPFDRNPAVFRDNYELFVVEPFDYTFRRPLGQDLAGF